MKTWGAIVHETIIRQTACINTGLLFCGGNLEMFLMYYILSLFLRMILIIVILLNQTHRHICYIRQIMI